MALKHIHEKYGTLIDYDRFDEFMGANKRLNGYSALQTTLNFPQGPVEIAITTHEQEEFNDWGVIKSIRNGDNNLKDYVLKLIFTPAGTIRFLPKSATGIDFAYAVNPRLGAEIESIKVDNVIMPPTTIIPNSSTVEVIAGSPKSANKNEFLKYCLPSTRKIIVEQIEKENRNKLANKGAEIMETILSTRGLLVLTDLNECEEEGKINQLLFYFGCQQLSDLYFKLGGGYITKERLSKELDRIGVTKDKLNLSTIRVKGVDEPGILNDVIHELNNFGRNILNIEMKKNKNKFNIRIVVEEMTPDEETAMSSYIKSDTRFEEGIVV